MIDALQWSLNLMTDDIGRIVVGLLILITVIEFLIVLRSGFRNGRYDCIFAWNFLGMVLASAVIGIGLYFTIKARKQKITLAHSLSMLLVGLTALALTMGQTAVIHAQETPVALDDPHGRDFHIAPTHGWSHSRRSPPSGSAFRSRLPFWGTSAK